MSSGFNSGNFFNRKSSIGTTIVAVEATMTSIVSKTNRKVPTVNVKTQIRRVSYNAEKKSRPVVQVNFSSALSYK